MILFSVLIFAVETVPSIRLKVFIKFCYLTQAQVYTCSYIFRGILLLQVDEVMTRILTR